MSEDLSLGKAEKLDDCFLLEQSALVPVAVPEQTAPEKQADCMAARFSLPGVAEQEIIEEDVPVSRPGKAGEA